jgi:hypothetical protein
MSGNISPNQSEWRIAGRRVAAYQERSWWGGTYWRADGLTDTSERRLKKALEAKYAKKGKQ